MEMQVSAADVLPGSHLFPAVRDGRQSDAHQGKENVRFHGVTYHTETLSTYLLFNLHLISSTKEKILGYNEILVTIRHLSR